jgi:membrane peptidoglycan carboxypeptidase
VARKVKEALLAYQVTQKLSKSQILSLYLNEIFYGNQAYGVEAAAQAYFAKSARDLTLAEAAVIAGLPQSPSAYDPFRNPVAAKARQSYVLEQMEKNGFITPQELEQARQAQLSYQRRKQEFLAPHWVMHIRDLVDAKYGAKVLYQGGLKIYTTLDLDLQNKMEEVARANKDNLAQRDAENTSIVVMNPKTGEVLAMVGSMDYWNADIDGQVNVATSERQPGSTIKPLVYLATFAKGWPWRSVAPRCARSTSRPRTRCWRTTACASRRCRSRGSSTAMAAPSRSTRSPRASRSSIRGYPTCSPASSPTTMLAC